MNAVDKFIASGILEMYILGQASDEEAQAVEDMATMYESVQLEIDKIKETLELFATETPVAPDATFYTFLIARINFEERLKNGETPTFPPMLHEGSKLADYAAWINREDLQLAEPMKDAYAHLIGYTPEISTAIVWLKYGAPPETHTTELEKFIIIEGSCEIIIGKDIHTLAAGDTLSIPLHVPHHVRVTSDCPCKFILQRIAA